MKIKKEWRNNFAWFGIVGLLLALFINTIQPKEIGISAMFAGAGLFAMLCFIMTDNEAEKNIKEKGV